MAIYFFTAKSFKGELRSGNLEAKDKRELARILRQEGYILISAGLKEKPKKRKFSISLPFLKKVSLAEKIMFTRNLQVMISAGVSLPRALKTLASQTKNRKFQKVLLGLAEEIIKGKSFSESLAWYPSVFSEIFCNLVKVGEETGTLEKSLEVLERQMERENELKAKIKGAMIYPAVIIVAMVGIGILMLIIVVPKLSQTFEELNVELPVTTRIVLGGGMFLAKFWYLFLLFSVFLFFFLRIAAKNKLGKSLVDSFLLNLPVIAPIIKKTNSAYAARTLSSLVGAGVPLVRSLEIVSGALSNIHYQEAMKEAAEKVRKGSKLAEAVESCHNLFPNIVSQMIEVGEETGETAGILGKLADFFEEEVARSTRNLSAIIEPALMIVIGVLVGFFAVSMIQPIYSMIGAIE